MVTKSRNYGPRNERIFPLIVTLILLLSIVMFVVPMFSPSASGTTHGLTGATSTEEEDNGPNDANPAFFQVRWDSSSNHCIEGNYTVSSGYPLTIDPGCNIYFNGSYSIIVQGTLYAQGTPASRITFTSNSTSPGIGNWSSIDFAGGGGSIEYCNIEYATEGIHLDSTNPIIISDNTITNCEFGINGTHPSPAFTNNDISYNNRSGIKIESPVSGVNFQATGNTIVGNMGGDGGIEVYSTTGTITAAITGNEVNDNSANGVYLWSSLADITATINGNTFDNNGHGPTSGDGIFIVAEGPTAILDATIQNNNITRNFWGIWLTNDWMTAGTDIVCNISSNKILDNGDGIYLDCWGSISADIWNNNLTNNSGAGAIYSDTMDGDGQYRIIDNVIWKNNDGIYLDYFYFTPANRKLYAEITHNRVENNMGSSIDLFSDEELELIAVRNEIYDNDDGIFAFSWDGPLTASIHHNSIQNNDGIGLGVDTLDILSLNMTGNQVTDNWYDNLYLYTDSNGFFDVRNNDFSGSLNGNGVFFENFHEPGIFKDNIVNGNAQSGLEFWDCINITILNTTLNNNLFGVTCYNSSVNITNSSILSTSYDFNLSSDSHVTALNTTFDNSSANFEDPESDLSVRWFLDVEVVDGNGMGVDSADVLVNDSLGSNEWSGNTGLGNNGWVYFIPATEYIQNTSGKTFTTPHNVSAKRAPEHGFSLPRIWKSRNVTVMINSKPDSEDLSPAGGFPGIVFRNSTLFIHSNASDFKDPEDQLIPYFDYRDPNSALWNTSFFSDPATYIGTVPSGYWSIPFSPPVSAPLGWYDFRVRFEDSIGEYSDYIYANDIVVVKNNPPVALDLTSESQRVFRTQSISIYANGTDVEDPEDLLTAYFEYYDPGSSSWTTDYLLGPTYNGEAWMVSFSPPSDAEPGMYDFHVSFGDSEGDLSNLIFIPFFVEVLNNVPTSTDIIISSSSVFRTDTLVIYANGFDVEDNEGDLTPHFEYLEPGETSWKTEHLFDPVYIGGQWRINFTPSSEALLGIYDFRVHFNDSSLAFSPWIYENQSVSVNNNLPMAEDISSSANEVYRGELVYIFANGSDTEDEEEDFSPEFSYRLIGSLNWDNIYFSGMTTTASGWRIEFAPALDMILGDYEIRMGFYDSAGDFSDWLPLIGSISVLNNKPKVGSIDTTDSQIYRTESTVVYASVSDTENLPADLMCSFEYKHSGSITWTDLPGESYSSSNDRFEVSFTPSATAEVGDYDFRVEVLDSDGASSGWKYLNESLEVQNNLPSVLDFTLSASEVFRGEEIHIYANAQDDDKDERDLIVTFEYSLQGGVWENLHLGTPEYTNSKWQVLFLASKDADFGDYSFRVRVDDGEELSNWMYNYNAVEVKNNLPIVQIHTPGVQESGTVSFTATVSDSEDSLSSLIFQWNFGDGQISSEQNPVHTFSESGSYTVSLTVTDDDGGVSVDTVQIEIEEETTPGSDDDTIAGIPLWLLLVLILCIVVVLISVIVLLKRKKPEEEIEVWQPEATAATTPSPPPSVTPPVAAAPAPTPEPTLARPLPPPPKQAKPKPKVAPVAPPPPTAAVKPEPTSMKNLKCPKCQKTFRIPLKKGPQSITCPHCGTSGKIIL
ncbi:MAG: right-handed parallel beta-helix repeat-containing protein [Thermoplasmata archaeon]|nr:MAG: right-handed parallel beta-helix repeat-containing protein [Thermoplasmata archaeon]